MAEYTSIVKTVSLGFGSTVTFHYRDNKTIHMITFKTVSGGRAEDHVERLTWHSTSKNLEDWLQKLVDEVKL